MSVPLFGILVLWTRVGLVFGGYRGAVSRRRSKPTSLTNGRRFVGFTYFCPRSDRIPRLQLEFRLVHRYPWFRSLHVGKEHHCHVVHASLSLNWVLITVPIVVLYS